MTEQRLNTVAAVAAAIVGMVMLVLLLIGGIFVDGNELQEALGATEIELKTDLNAAEGRLKTDLNAAEGRLTATINASTERTDAQMEELRGYIINHLDRSGSETTGIDNRLDTQPGGATSRKRRLTLIPQ